MKWIYSGIVWLLRQPTRPLAWIRLSRSQRIWLVLGSYLFGSCGLWLLFPTIHNGVTMFLPIIVACWLFLYRGLLWSMVLNGIIFQLFYLCAWRGTMPDSDFVEGRIAGVLTSLLLALMVCWLRQAVEETEENRQRSLATEQARLLLARREQEAMLAYEQQRQLNRMKDLFLLNVGHELRTPLTILGGYLELLAAHHTALDVRERDQVLREANQGLETLLTLVDQVLEATRLSGEVPALQMEIVALATFVHTTLIQLSLPELISYRLQVRIPPEYTAWADREFLRHILGNLLRNCCKYVPPATTILIEATLDQATQSICLSVKDEGPGIPADEIPLLFEKFVRLKRDQTGSISGTGLGLYICKQMVEAMGGCIWVESADQPGKGSRFCLSLSARPMLSAGASVPDVLALSLDV